MNLMPWQTSRFFFTAIEYGMPYHILTKSPYPVTQQVEVLLVCGIANPKPLKQYLLERASTYYQLDYSDHHIFRIDDLKEIQKKFEAITAQQKIIVTTEKDAVRLMKFTDQLQQLPLYVLPIKHSFLFNQGQQFNKAVVNFIKDFKGPVSN